MDQNISKYSCKALFGSDQIQKITGISALIFFLCSSARHLLFQSTAFDLAWFDQAIYLISQGEPPIVSFSGFHILGDHAAFIFYPIALLYWIYPSVYWLFALQAIALSLGTVMTWHLAVQADLNLRLATAVALSYILYPLVFNVNLFDFHPEVIAIPGILAAVLVVRSPLVNSESNQHHEHNQKNQNNQQFNSGLIKRILLFTGLMILVLSCKAVLSLTVLGFGIWLLFLENKRSPLKEWCGVVALGLGLGWFLITTQWIFPFFTGGQHAAVGRYSYLGESVLEIALNLFRQPNVIFTYAFSWQSLEYLLLLFVPLGWGLSSKSLAHLFPVLPQLALNLLSNAGTQRDLIHQYSVPILPFLVLAAIAALSTETAWLKVGRSITLWSIIGFVALAKPGYFWTRYLSQIDTWDATREAIAQVDSSGGVLTTANIAPHLSHRSLIRQTLKEVPCQNSWSKDLELNDLEPSQNPKDLESSQNPNQSCYLDRFKYILLNRRHPGWGSNPEFVEGLLIQLQHSPEFIQQYQQDDVYLFVQRS